MHGLIAPSINLLILVGLLAYFLREPLKAFVRQRHDSVREGVERAHEELRLAQERYTEFTAKLSSLGLEAESLRDQIRADSHAARDRVLEQAKLLSTHIVGDARETSQGLVNELRTQLYIEFGARVVDRAEGLLKDRLTGDDRARIREEFSRQLEGST